MTAKQVHSIVLDTSPILNNTPSISTLLAKCEKLYTVPSIIDEVRDKNARSRLEIMIFPILNVRIPKPESIRFVSDFSRRTGDSAVLSKPDIQILALAYELECEQNGGDWRLRKLPGVRGSNGAPPKAKDDAFDEPTQDDEPLSIGSSTPAIQEISASDQPLFNVADGSRGPSPGVSGAMEMNQLAEEVDGLQIAESSMHQDAKAELNNDEATTLPEVNPAKSDSDLSNSDGWITPKNFKKQQEKDQNTSTVPMPEGQVMQVATITGDFAMQNVLLQIGLNLLSPSLHRVKNIRTYILRCHACFEKVRDMDKQFCPRCGKPTLTRVSCSTNQKGEFKLHLKKNMQWNHRGDRFSIPKPVSGTAHGKVGQGKGGGKGGWGQELILAEDQKEYLRETSRSKGKKETDLMDEDYLPGILTGERRRAGGRPKIGGGRNVNSKKRS